MVLSHFSAIIDWTKHIFVSSIETWQRQHMNELLTSLTAYNNVCNKGTHL